MHVTSHQVRIWPMIAAALFASACDGILAGDSDDDMTGLSCPLLQERCNQGKDAACQELAIRCSDKGVLQLDRGVLQAEKGVIASDKSVTQPEKGLVQADGKPIDTTPPSVNLTAPAGGTTFTTVQTVKITAAASDNVGVVKVEFYDGSTLKGTAATAPYDFSWALTAAMNGAHPWRAKAYDAADNSTISPVVNLTVAIPTLPAAPTGVVAVAGVEANTISWNAVAGATSYKLYWSKTSGVTPSNGNLINGVTSPYVHSSLTTGVAYYYVVAAVNSVGTGPASAQVSATPLSAPDTQPPSFAGLASATATSSSQVTLSWAAASDTVTPAGGIVYLVYQSNSSMMSYSTTSLTTAAGAISTVVSGLSAATTYYFAVRAKDAAGNIETNTVVRNATTSAAGPPPPYGTTVGLTANNFTVPDCYDKSFTLYDQFTKYSAIVLGMNDDNFG
jgi:hypothetical protein